MKLSQNDLRFVVQHLPKDIRNLLVRNKGLMVGGGFIRAVVAGEKISDIDMFGAKKERLKDIAVKLVMERTGSKMHESKNAITILTENRLPIQFITRWTFNSPEELSSSFDFTVCQGVVFYNQDTKKWDSVTGENFYQDLAARRLVYTFPVREEEAGGSMLRALKYVKRGYNIQIDSLAGVMSRVATKIVSHENFSQYSNTEHSMTRYMKAELREVDPLMVIDGLDILDDHETDLEEDTKPLPTSPFDSDDIPF